jgi:type II secretory pathway pseudopilin PulG
MLSRQTGQRKPQQGSSLLEVLITIVILAFGLLGLAAFQSKVQVAEVESYQRAQAILALADMSGTSDTSKNAYVDKSGNTIASYPGSTTAGQNLTSGFAFKADGSYDSIATTCGKNYIIYLTVQNIPSTINGSLTYGADNAGPTIPKGAASNADEWARFLYRSQNPQVVTYVIDTYTAGNTDATYGAALKSIATQGGGDYIPIAFTGAAAADTNKLVNALLKIFQEIQAVNTTFASASLRVNTTNRAQDKNEVFIPMFRPDSNAKPRGKISGLWGHPLTGRSQDKISRHRGVRRDATDLDSRTAANHARFFIRLVANKNRTGHPSGSSATAAWG